MRPRDRSFNRLLSMVPGSGRKPSRGQLIDIILSMGNNNMKKILLASSVIFLSAQAYAGSGAQHYKGCKPSDMNGDWVAYQAEVLKNPHTGVCHFKVFKGQIKEGTCDFNLTDQFGNALTGLNFDGTAKVEPDCSTELTMDFRPYGRPFVSTFNIQLAPDKQSYVGRWKNTFGAIGPTNGVKTLAKPIAKPDAIAE